MTFICNHKKKLLIQFLSMLFSILFMSVSINFIFKPFFFLLSIMKKKIINSHLIFLSLKSFSGIPGNLKIEGNNTYIHLITHC